jgi:Zn-finger nucleic acid-binding protein
LRYIAGSADLGLWYERREKEELVLNGYSDSNLAGDVNCRKSTSGVFFFLCGSAISRQSTKQRVVALSSSKAEYIAVSAASCRGVWLARLLGEMLEKIVARAVIRIDNKSAITLVKNPVHHDRRKHIDVSFHFLRECAQDGLHQN